MKIIEGGVCAAKGFKAGAMRCGIRKSHTKKDLAMILSDWASRESLRRKNQTRLSKD